MSCHTVCDLYFIAAYIIILVCHATLSQMTVVIFEQILFPVIYCTIVYFMTDQPQEGLRYTKFLTITILTCLVAQSIGLLIGTVAPSLPVSFERSYV